MGFLRVLLLYAVGLTAIYVLVSLYSRSIRKERLEKRWDEKHGEGTDPAAREAYVAAGMEKYHSGLRKRLILLVYVVPIVAITVVWWLTNSK